MNKTPDRATALWFTTNGKAELRMESLPKPAAGEVLVRGLYSAVSEGTERCVRTGGVPTELYASMKVPYMGGSFERPVKYGYSLVGRVETPGQLQGRYVHVMHPHQDLAVVNEADCFVLPEGLTPRVGCLISNMETALNAAWDAEILPGDRVLVVGMGAVGNLISSICRRIPGVELTTLECKTDRIAWAEAAGFSCIDTLPQELHSTFDVAFHVSGATGGLQTALDSVGQEGRVIELSWYGDKPVTVQLGGGFHYGRKKIISSQVSNIPVTRASRWDFSRRKKNSSPYSYGSGL